MKATGIATAAADALSKGKHNMRDGQIRYLKQWEKQRTRSMYEMMFPEDSKAFVDYYYQWKIEENEVIVMEEAGPVQGPFFHVMIHLNPYILWCGGTQMQIPYLVAVATHPDCRRQGKMGQVMGQALRDLEKKHTPFTFLLPANSMYYLGLGFVYFPCNNQSKIRQYTERQTIRAAQADRFLPEGTWQKASKETLSELADFSNQILKERYDIFITRDKFYYERLLQETAVEEGGVLLLKKEGHVCGLLVYAMEKADSEGRCRAQVKELLLEEEVLEEEAELICSKALSEVKVAKKEHLDVKLVSSEMMVRIASLRDFVPWIKSKNQRNFYVKVTDSIVDANNGCFWITTNREGGKIQKIPKEQVTRKIDISMLAQELLNESSVYLNEWV